MHGKDKLACKHNTSCFGTKKTLIARSFKTPTHAVRHPDGATAGRQAHESRFRKIVGVMLYSLCKVLLDCWTTWSQPHNDHRMSLSTNGKDISNARLHIFCPYIVLDHNAHVRTEMPQTFLGLSCYPLFVRSACG